MFLSVRTAPEKKKLKIARHSRTKHLTSSDDLCFLFLYLSFSYAQRTLWNTVNPQDKEGNLPFLTHKLFIYSSFSFSCWLKKPLVRMSQLNDMVDGWKTFTATFYSAIKLFYDIWTTFSPRFIIAQFQEILWKLYTVLVSRYGYF